MFLFEVILLVRVLILWAFVAGPPFRFVIERDLGSPLVAAEALTWSRVDGDSSCGKEELADDAADVAIGPAFVNPYEGLVGQASQVHIHPSDVSGTEIPVQAVTAGNRVFLAL